MALNKPERIEAHIKRCKVSLRQWREKVQATINQGHVRSASFYETKVDALVKTIEELKGQEVERQQQEEAREDFAQRMLALETRAFDMTVLRRKRELHLRAALERQAREEHLPPTETTHLDLLPQTWECVRLLVQLLEHHMAARIAMSGGVFGEEEEDERQEVEALKKWMELRAEFEMKKRLSTGVRQSVKTRSTNSTADVMAEEKKEQEILSPIVWDFQQAETEAFESVAWQNVNGHKTI